MKLLVTGANGFVGRSLCSESVRRGHSTRGAVRTVTTGFDLCERVAVGAVDLDTNWSEALLGVDVVVHLAARVHVMKDNAASPLLEFRKTNVLGSLNLARQASAAGVRRFVFLSSVKVNGELTQRGQAYDESTMPAPRDAYGQSKQEAEAGLMEIGLDTGMEIVIVRPPLVYGPGVKANFAALIRAVRQGWPLPLASVRNQRSLVALDNLVDFILTCVTHPHAANQTFLVSDGHDLSTAELVRGVARAAQVSPRLFFVPVWVLRGGAALLGKEETMQRLCGNLQLDIAKARRLLGWTPLISVDEGLRRAVIKASAT